MFGSTIGISLIILSTAWATCCLSIQ